jgi:hypothetical protein
MKHVLIVIVTLLLASVALAGEEPRLGRDVAEFLQLTPAQQTAWESAQADFRSATAPLFARREQLGHDMETALKAKSTDACSLGNMLLASQAVIDQVKAQKEILQQRVDSFLTPDQRTKYEAFKAAQPQVFERRRVSGR